MAVRSQSFFLDNDTNTYCADGADPGTRRSVTTEVMEIKFDRSCDFVKFRHSMCLIQASHAADGQNPKPTRLSMI